MPYLEAQYPAPGTIDVAADTLISCRIRDDGYDGYIVGTSVRAYIKKLPSGPEEVAYDGYDGYDGYFVAPYDGPGSLFDAYDADGYSIVIDRTSSYDEGSIYQVRIEARDSADNPLPNPGDRWSFSTAIPPYLEAQFPAPGADAVVDTLVSCRIRDDGYVVGTSIRAYIKKLPSGPEEVAYDGYDGYDGYFVAPYDGPGSSLSPYVSDGYSIVIDRVSDYHKGGTYQVRMEARDTAGNPLPDPGDRWSFSVAEAIPPYLEAQFPAPGATDVAANALVSCRIRDDDGYVVKSSIRAYVKKLPSGLEEMAYDGYDGYFIAPYDGPGSSLASYAPDGYSIALDRTSAYSYGGLYQVRLEAEDQDGYSLSYPDDRWSFQIMEEPSAPPYITNIDPPQHANISADALITFDVGDQAGDVSGVATQVFIAGELAYDGIAGFHAPYDGPDAYFGRAIVDGYDGYHFRIDRTSDYPDGPLHISTSVSDKFETVVTPWSYMVGTKLNRVYLSDGYGLKVIEIGSLTGESQGVVSLLLSMDTDPSLPSNDMSCISGSYVDGYYFLVLSMKAFGQEIGNVIGLDMMLGDSLIGDYSLALLGQMIWGQGVIGPGDGYGVVITKNETESINTYARGSLGVRAQMNERGILYLINRTRNRIEVYYGSHFRDGNRNPDFVYSETSTPPIMPGYILDLLVVNNASARSFNNPEGAPTFGTRIFVGTTEGMTRIDTWDQEGTDGYCAGMDAYGIAVNYGIAGSGAQYELIGGTASQVTRIACDQTNTLVYVATFDGVNIGGVSQISLASNKRTIFMTKETNFLPSNDVRDIFGKTY